MSIEMGKAERFSRKMCDVLNYSALNLAMSIGYEAGILETMAGLEKAEPCEVLDAAGEAVKKGCFDYITAFDSIHDQTKPFEALQNIYAMLKPEGVFSMIDIAAGSSIEDNMNHPMGAFLYTVSLMHCMPVPSIRLIVWFLTHVRDESSGLSEVTYREGFQSVGSIIYKIS